MKTIAASFVGFALVVPALFPKVSPAQTNNPAWHMFHHDERHTGFCPGIGKFPTNETPALLWRIEAFPTVVSNTLCGYRFYSGFPLVDLNGDGTLDVVATGPDDTSGTTCPGGTTFPGLTNGLVAAIHTTNRAASLLWEKTFGTTTNAWAYSDWFDQYSAAAVNCDDDPRPDVVFIAKSGVLRAVSGLTGDLIWEYATGRFIEAGPMIADLDRDGTNEIIVITGDPYVRPGCSSVPALLIFRLRPPSPGATNAPIRVVEFPTKLDSNEPAIVDLNPVGRTNSKTIVFGSWSDAGNTCPPDQVIPAGLLHAVWFDLAGGPLSSTSAVVHVDSISVSNIAAHGPEGQASTNERPVIRSSPLIWDFGEGETAVFGWMGDFNDIESARISAVGLAFSTMFNRVEFTPRWTRRYVQAVLGGVTNAWPVMDWKPSVALLPVPGGPPLVVSAGGKGLNPNEAVSGGQTGNYGVCLPSMRGWVGAFDRTGSNVWSQIFTNEGNIRGSCAVADLDGDGINDVVVTFGCLGKVRAFNGLTGKAEWSYQLGDPAREWTQRSICSPSIGDVNGDGLLDVVVSAFDGHIYCLSGYDFRVTSVTLDMQRHPTFTWKSFGGTRYRVQFRNGSPDGAFTDIIASEQTDFHYPGRVGTLSFTDDFTQTDGPPPTGGRFYRIRIMP